MGVVIGRLDDQVAKIFLGNNLTKSTKDYQKILEDESIPQEEKERILAAMKEPIPWAEGLPLNADGYVCDYYETAAKDGFFAATNQPYFQDGPGSES